MLSEIGIKDGWLSYAKCVPSPNFNDRPDPNDISLLVVHNISLPPGEYGQTYQGTPLIECFFCNQLPLGIHPFLDSIVNMQVSAHLLIYRNGDVVQFVPFDKRAWHAGQSAYKDRVQCNDFSIGIELEGDDDTAFTQAQYAALRKASQIIMQEYPSISLDRIVGHSEIAPERKTDPGPAFNWPYFLKSLDGL